jgi:hypothetical protein
VEPCHFCAAIAAFRLRNKPFLDQTCLFSQFVLPPPSAQAPPTELNIVVVEGEGGNQ